MKKVYIAEFNYCTYESSFGVISIHESKKGANEAVEKHKKSYLKRFKQRELLDYEVYRVRSEEVFP